MLEETQETEEIIQRVAALDVGKAELTCCVRVPGQGRSGRRLQEVRAYQTMTRWLLVMTDRLAELGVTRVVMEATSDYWKGVYYLLEAHGFEVWLVNARDVKHLPGTAQDRHAGCGLAVQARRAADAAAQLRATTGDPAAGTWPATGPTWSRSRTAEKQRVEKLLEDAQIKLSVVASDIFGVSGRAMLAALVAGSATPRSSRSRPAPGCAPNSGLLVEAFSGFFTDQHAFLLAKMLARVDQLDADLAELDAKLGELIAPWLGRSSGWMRSPGSASSPHACCSPSWERT